MRFFRLCTYRNVTRHAILDAIFAHLGGVREAQIFIDAVIVVHTPEDPDTSRAPHWANYVARYHAERGNPVPVIETGLPGCGLVAGRRDVGTGQPVITVPDLYDAIYELGAALECRSSRGVL